MTPDDNVWLVSKDNPKPDPYIAILVREKESQESCKESYKVCRSAKEALAFALELKKKYGVKQVRLFYPDNVSIIVNYKRKLK